MKITLTTQNEYEMNYLSKVSKEKNLARKSIIAVSNAMPTNVDILRKIPRKSVNLGKLKNARIEMAINLAKTFASSKQIDSPEGVSHRRRSIEGFLKPIERDNLSGRTTRYSEQSSKYSTSEPDTHEEAANKITQSTRSCSFANLKPLNVLNTERISAGVKDNALQMKSDTPQSKEFKNLNEFVNSYKKAKLSYTKQKDPLEVLEAEYQSFQRKKRTHCEKMRNSLPRLKLPKLTFDKPAKVVKMKCPFTFSKKEQVDASKGLKLKTCFLDKLVLDDKYCATSKASTVMPRLACKKSSDCKKLATILAKGTV